MAHKFSMVHEQVEQQIMEAQQMDKVGGAMADLRLKAAHQHKARQEEIDRQNAYYEQLQRQQDMANAPQAQARFAGDDAGYMFQDHHQHSGGCCEQGQQQDPDAPKDGEDEDDSDFDDDEFLNDPELNKLRTKRLMEMKGAHDRKQEMLAKGHGSYREVCQDDFLKEVACDDFCVVHFYHKDFQKCKVIDHHMPRIAHEHLETKFLKIDAEKCPFFVDKLKIRVLPCVIGFSNGIAKDERIMGFEGLNENLPEDKKDEWPTSALQRRLAEIGVIKYTPPTEELEQEIKERSGGIFEACTGGLGDFEDYA